MSDATTIELSDIDAIVAFVGGEPASLIPLLRAIQQRYHYLPEVALRRIAATTQITAADVAGVASFYSQFRMQPAGRHTVKVCIGTACHVKGADDIYNALRLHLGIDGDADTDTERLFTVEKVACLGCCMLAPAVQIDDITYGFIEPGKVDAMLVDFLTAQQVTGAEGDTAVASDAASGAVRICLCSSCVAGGSLAVHTALQQQAGELHLPVTVEVVGCSGLSYQTPLVEIAMRDGRRFHYGLVEPADSRELLLRHFRPGRRRDRLRSHATRLLERLLTDETWAPVTRYAVDLRSGANGCYTGCQQRLVTEHAGELNPLDLDGYLVESGFAGLARSLEDGADAVIELVKASGLRGRGGGGYPTGEKWQRVHDAPGTEKVVICNGDEGDPGAFMDRMILESFPFRVLEGMLIAAYAVGAKQAILYIRSEYPLAADRVRQAIRILKQDGIPGVERAPFIPELTVEEGAGAFVCGEESALIQALEGKRGMPRLRPPYPSECGLRGRPTLVNNVETFALLPWTLRHGATALAEIGTTRSCGTKAFALAGKVVRGGLIEVPMGISLRRIVDEIGGGVPNGKQLKAVQVGGPSGGCLPARLCDTPVDYEALASHGTMMGSGGLVVLDEDDCMVDIARYFLDFTQHESCGKCTYCRIGTKRMLEILERLCEGRGGPGDLDELEHLAEVTRQGSLCGLGRTAPNPVLSTLAHFRDEYAAHIEGWCPAGKCKSLIAYRVTTDCIGCTKCAQACGAEAIVARPHQQHEIDLTLCTRCDACRQVCPVNAIEVGRRVAEGSV